MLHIRRFIDKMSVADSKQTKDLVLPMLDARGLRDDITKLLSDLHELTVNKNKEEDGAVVQVEIKGGAFK
jgi:hypothetical protein